MNGKKIIAFIMVLALVMCGGVTAFADNSSWNTTPVYPTDILGTELLTPVKFLIDKKVITGDEDGLFRPQKSITRAEFATMMAKATNNINELDLLKDKNTFVDLAGYDWAKGYINACTKASLMQGVGNEKFAPAKEVTYAEVITVIIRSKNVSAVETSVSGSWPNNYIQYAQMYNMLGDVTVTDWYAPATKGDVAKLLYRSMPKNNDKDDEK